ncbi:MAG: hypothetical protein FJ276_18220 [Planctomycetes bacterium]|nr:hypothetical protein [Planctomycetota bacterium]
MMQTVFVILFLAGNGLVPDASGKPAVTHVGMVAPDVIAITIRAQSVEHGKQATYEPQPGDEIVAWRQQTMLPTSFVWGYLAATK